MDHDESVDNGDDEQDQDLDQDPSHLVLQDLVFCQDCIANDVDRKVPKCLLALHQQLVHIDAAEK